MQAYKRIRERGCAPFLAPMEMGAFLSDSKSRRKILSFKTLKRKMKQVTIRPFDVRAYIERAAMKAAARCTDKERAERLYNSTIKRGRDLWAYLRKSLSAYEAEPRFRLYFGHEMETETETAAEIVPIKRHLKPGPELWSFSTKVDFDEIRKKLSELRAGNKSEKNLQKLQKSLANDAYIFTTVKPDFYRPERHGKWITESEFSRMMNLCGKILEKYGQLITVA